MAVKKSFKTELNPAMQFISVPEVEDVEVDEKPEREPPVGTEPILAQPPAGYKANPLYIETKSRRLQLLLQPSLYEKIKDKAKATGVSVNEWVHACLDGACQDGEKE